MSKTPGRTESDLQQPLPFLEFYNRDHLNYMINNINKKKGTPYNMSNEPLADLLFPQPKRNFLTISTNL